MERRKFHIFIALSIGIILFQFTTIVNSQPIDYNRKDWKHWVDEDHDGQNTREEVIEEEKLTIHETNIIFWTCLYTGEVFRDPIYMDADHMIPLKWANDHGGSSWTPERKREFANDLTYPDHIVLVSASSNRQKGAKGPSKWKPPITNAWCWYAKAWAKIIHKYQLIIPPNDAIAIVEMIGTCEN